MTTTRRILVLAGMILAVMIGTSIPASATFADSVAVPTMKITTGTVQAPTGLVLKDFCMTTTTTVRRTTYTDPATGASWQTAYSYTSTSVTSTSNVQSSSTTTTAGPGYGETTTTTVTTNTNLHVSLSWSASTSPRVTGYVVSAHLGLNGSSVPLLSTAGTSVSQIQDADNLYYQPSLFVTTQTNYGWTADSARTVPLSC